MGIVPVQAVPRLVGEPQASDQSVRWEEKPRSAPVGCEQDRQADSTPSTIRIPRPLAPPSPQRLSEHVPGHHHRGLKLLRHALENNERSVHHLVQVRDYTATLNQRAYSARVITGYFLQRSRA